MSVEVREEAVSPDGSKGRVYAIPHTNLGTFYDQFNKLVKRAARIGITPPSYLELRQEPKVIHVEREDEEGEHTEVEVVIMYHYLAIFHPSVILLGFRFLGKLEHTEEGNVLHILEGETVPHKYRDCPPWCDHCKVSRRRNDTFVLVEEATGSYRQIGRNCLADYLGRDAEKYADAAEIYYTLDQLGLASEESHGGGGGGGQDYVMLPNYLAYVSEVISRIGWKSRGSAYHSGGVATADEALRHMWRPPRSRENDYLFRSPTEKSYQIAKEAIVWAEELPDDQVEASDYLWNIRVIAKRGVVGSKQFGFAASIVSSYQKFLGQLERQKRQQEQPSEWIGEVGERRLFTLLCEKVITMEGQYGVSLLHLMSDKDGNRFIWFSHSISLDMGKNHLIKATIKKHTERQGVKQTQLERCEEVVLQDFTATARGGTYNFQAVDEKEARKELLSMLGVSRLPKGTTIVCLGAAPTAPAVEPIDSGFANFSLFSEET